jgi:peptidoglycan/xylan/chitin deacetylase (PgdA/CDA1 family)
MNHILKDCLYYGASRVGELPFLRARLEARAVIILFHEIQRDCRSELMTGTSISLFEYSLNWLQQDGWSIVSLDECLKRLAANDRSRRYAVLTFDDGYRDNVSVALPVMERHNAPFMIYVPTGAPTRSMQTWWLGLRKLFLSADIVTIDAIGRQFHCSDLRSKVSALDEVTRWIHQDYRRAASLAPTFKQNGISLSALNNAYFLDERELRILARHPLASIGGHTTSHAALTTLDESSARAELLDNRNYLQDLLQSPIRHVAYPYGAYGPREEHLAGEVGFHTAVTTWQARLYDRKANYFALPRIGAYSRSGFRTRMGGIIEAVQANGLTRSYAWPTRSSWSAVLPVGAAPFAQSELTALRIVRPKTSLSTRTLGLIAGICLYLGTLFLVLGSPSPSHAANLLFKSSFEGSLLLGEPYDCKHIMLAGRQRGRFSDRL